MTTPPTNPSASLGARRQSIGFLLAYVAFAFVSYPIVLAWFGETLGKDTLFGVTDVFWAGLGYVVLTLALMGLLVQRIFAMIMSYESAIKASEIRLRNVIESTSDWVWEIDDRFIFTFCNSRVTDILGYAAEEVLGHGFCDFLIPAEVAATRALLENAVRKAQRITLSQMTFLHKDGRPIHVESSGVPVLCEEGGCRALRGMNRDITDRVTAEAAIRERDERYRSLFACIREGMAIFTLVFNERGEPEDYIIRDVNPAFETMIGVHRQEVIGQRATKLHSLLKVLAEESVVRMLISQDAREAETPIEVALPEEKKHLLISALPLVNGQSGVLITDFTERKMAHEALVRTSVYYRVLFDEFPLPTWRSDSKGRIVYVNLALKDLVGEALETGASWYELVHEDDAQAWREQYLAATEKREPFSFTYRIASRDGRYTRVLHVGRPLFDSEGDYIGYIGYMQPLEDQATN